MGVIYKITPKVREYILKIKKSKPHFGCRRISGLVNEKFHIKVSKSHISAILKLSGLNSKVGRSRKPKRGITEGDGLGAYVLRATDLLLKGKEGIVEVIKGRLNKEIPEVSKLTEALIYMPLFDSNLRPDSGLWKLIKRRYSYEEIMTYLVDLQRVAELKSDILSVIDKTFQDVLFIRLFLNDGSSFVLDSQLHSLWSSPHIPFDFATTLCNIRSYMNKHLLEALPIVLFNGPGYEVLPKDWFHFLIKLSSPEVLVERIGFYGMRDQEIDTLVLQEPKKLFIIFGLWPWQYIKNRKVESLGEFKPHKFPIQKEQYIAETMIKLSQPTEKKEVTLKGIGIKKALEAKSEIVILSNLKEEQASFEQIAEIYLNRWPKLQQGFREFSRKIELFTYSASSRQIFSADKVISPDKEVLDVKESLLKYLEALDLYVRWNLLPAEYKKSSFSTTKMRFYRQRARLKKRKNNYFLKFILPEDYGYLKELNYLLTQLNKQQVIFPDGKQLICRLIEQS